MALPENVRTHLIPALLLIYQPRKDERLSWPSWLTCSGRFTHISGHPSTAGRAQSSPVRDRRSTAVPCHQLYSVYFSYLLWFVCAGRMYRCVRCPTAYHANDLCIAAGSIHLTGLDIICSRHFAPDVRANRRYHSRVNVSWCFICSEGLMLLS